MTTLDTHKEDDIRNTEINDIRKIKRGRYGEGDGIKTPNGDDIKDIESDDIRNTLKEKMLETLRMSVLERPKGMILGTGGSYW